MLKREDGHHFEAQLDCRAMGGPGPGRQLRLTLTELSQRRLAAKNRRIAASGYETRETERRAMAVRLHEGLGQRLAALKLHLGTLTPCADDGTKRLLVETMALELDQAVALVRRMSADLHPLMLSDLGLRAALEWLVSDVAERLDLRANLHFDDDDATLPQPLAIAIYRLIEAALVHFAPYVRAGISVELLRRPRDWVLVLQIVPGHERTDGPAGSLMSLPHGFKDQVHLLGGRLEFSELPGHAQRMLVFLGHQAIGVAGPAPGSSLA